MNDLELSMPKKLCFLGLGEASTTAIARGRDARGFDENKSAARKAGR